MTPTIITSAAPALANHLWQSTAFAATIWLLTLLLRNNHARIRYTLWLAASIKFLLPFSLLITLGTLLPRPQQIAPPSTIYSAIDTASQPFTQLDTIAPATPTPTLDLKARLTAQLPTALAILWLCGALTVLLIWLTRWRHVHATLKRSIPITAGRELEILRRLQTQSPTTKPITLLRSPDLMEPGIFGILRPTLLWPNRLSDQLEDHHIEAILSHETIHVHRRDNLTAALHMLVEAIFWFHPLVWWMERHMIEERERACDEAVVQQGGNPETYAESLLKACRFCIESPLPCISGITGADLSRRVRSIMTLQLEKLSTIKKLSLLALGTAALTGPLAFGVMRMAPLHVQILHATDPMPAYEVATVRPWDGSGYFGRPLRTVIQDAFNIPTHAVNRLIGPSWINTKSYVIQGKIPDSLREAMQKMPPAEQAKERQLLTQSLLADRFKLKVHFETRNNMPIFELVQAKGGAKLKESTRPASENGGIIMGPRGQLTHSRAINASVDNIIAMLMMDSEIDGHTIIDKTGLTGRYDVVLDWLPSRLPAVAVPGSLIQPDTYGPPPAPGTEGPSLFTALQEQLGLRLIATKGPVEIVVIDHIEEPSTDPGGEAPPAHSNNETQAKSLLTAQAGSASEPVKTSNAAPNRDYRFEVISIHLANPPADRPNQVSVARFTFKPSSAPIDRFQIGRTTLPDLFMQAFGVKQHYQLEYPDWMSNTYFSINATMPEGTTRKDIPIMLQHLLEDRFGLVFHAKTTFLSGFEMVKVKSGSAIAPSMGPASGGPPAIPKFKDGIPQLAKDVSSLQEKTLSQEVWLGRDKSMGELAQDLSASLEAPVADGTGLSGNYDYTLVFTTQTTPETDTTSKYPYLREALEQQLGIKLQSKKNVPVTILVIDKALKTPTDN